MIFHKLIFKTLIFVSFFSVWANSIFSQNYTILGNATSLGGCNCFQLTQDAKNRGGAIFQNQTINLNNSFDFTFNVFLGCNGSGGADGIVFVLTSNPNGLGAAGEHLGYGNGSNQPYSLAVEFDTWQNGNQGDPSYDHIGINAGGVVTHNVYAPVAALPGQGNIDNCQWYLVRIVWDVNSNTYSVYFNGVLRIQIVIPNMVSTYFGGNPIVNWGWSGATGGGTNDQRVCVESISNWVAGVNYQSCNTTLQFTDISTSDLGTVQSWAWDFGDGTTSSLQNPVHTFAGLGTYNVSLTITDITGCTYDFSHPVTINAPITLTPTFSDPPCNGGLNGSIGVTPTGGFGVSAGYGGYSYSWNNNANNMQTWVGVGAGTYSVVVTDGVCSATGQYTLNQPTPVTATTSHTDASCGASNGSVSITLSGGTPPYQNVVWAGFPATGGPNTFTRTGLGANYYIADFTDFNGCSALLQYRENVNALPCGINASASSTNVSCFGGANGTATLTVTGGAPPAIINWSNGGTGATITGLTTGTYTYYYSDGNPANSFSGTVTVTQPGAAMVGSLTTLNMSCANTNDGEALASVISGGTPPYNYTWSGGQPNTPALSNLSPGPISVVITDVNGCTSSASGTVTGPPALTLNITAIDDSCYQSRTGSATANVSGGNPPYTFYWSNISSAQTNLTMGAGNYTVTVTDSRGCTITGNTTLSEPPALSYSITSQDVLCHGDATGSINVAVNGGTPGYNYQWNPPAATGSNPTGLTADIYYLSLTDGNNCLHEDSVVITQPDSVFAVTSASTNVNCHGADDGTITLNISGGTSPYSYLGNPVPGGTTVLNNLSPNTYSGNVTDANGCSVLISETITEPGPQSLVLNNTNAVCNGDTSSTASADFVNATGAVTYVWTGGLTGANLTGLAAGVYDVTATDANSCELIGSVTITEPPAPVLNVNVTDASCYGAEGSATVNPSGGTPPYSYTWSHGVGNFQTVTLPAGNYTVTATDAATCNQIGNFTVNEPDSIGVTVQSTDVLCQGENTGSIILTLTNGGIAPFTFTWSPDVSQNNSALSLQAGDYNFTITDADACTVTQTITLNEPDLLVAVSTITDATCFGFSDGQINAAATGGIPAYTYTLSTGAQNSTGVFTGLNAGDYQLTITDANGCSDVLPASILSDEPVLVSVSPDPAKVYQAETVLLTTETNQTGVLQFTWLPSDGLSCSDCDVPEFIGSQSGSYTVTVINEQGCTGQHTVQVEVIDGPGIFVPNAFSPNSDGVNDTWEIFGNLAGIEQIQVLVFNRWGEKIFSSNSPNFAWDGTYHGKILLPDVFVYHIRIDWLANRPVSNLKGSVTLMK